MKTSARPLPMRRKTRRAFTIVEVLVALLIFSIMSIGIIGAYLNILAAYERVKTRPSVSLDVRFARNALLTESDFETAQKGDNFEGATGRQVTWSAVIEPTITADLFLVTFTCELGPGNTPDEKEETVVEVFRLLRPTWSVTSGFSPDAATLRAEARDRITEAQQPSPLSGISGGSSSSSGGGSKSGGSTGNTGGAGGGKSGGSGGASAPTRGGTQGGGSGGGATRR